MPSYDYVQSKFTESKHEHNNVMTQMQREIDVLRATEQTFRKKTLELELDNDDLERTERWVLMDILVLIMALKI